VSAKSEKRKAKNSFTAEGAKDAKKSEEKLKAVSPQRTQRTQRKELGKERKAWPLTPPPLAPLVRPE
jgi:hypothetical protein